MLIKLLTSNLIPILISGGVIIAGIGGAYLYVYNQGKSDQIVETKTNNLKEVVRTRKKIDEAISNSPTDGELARQWLRERNSRISKD